MLLAVSGSQGLGKSTLITALQQQFVVEVITRKTSRSVLSDWGVSLSEVNNDRPLTMKFQDEILKRKVEDESCAAADPDKIWITERTFADLFTYSLVALGKDNECSEWVDGYYERCKVAQGSYDHVFYLSNSGRFPGKIENDGVRAINHHYCQMVDMTMSHYTTAMSRRVHPVWSGEVDLRIATMLRACPSLGSMPVTTPDP